jgi:hypothetical protein
MITTTAVTDDVAHAAGRRVLGAVVATEARRCLIAPWLWLGIVATSWLAQSSTEATFAAGGYRGVMGSFAAAATGVFVLGVNAGARDHTSGGAVAPEAAVDADDRALGRLLGLWPAVSVATLCAAAVFVVQRIEGGMRIADSPTGHNEAVYSMVEMLQPPLLFAFAAAAGVALGRSRVHRSAATVTGALVLAATGFVYWAWQWTPAVWVTPVQTQPIEVRLRRGFSPRTAPADWILSAPDRYQSTWGRVVVHQAMAGWHLVYLLGLASLFAGFAVRGRRGRFACIIGLVMGIGAVVAQALVTPANLAGA